MPAATVDHSATNHAASTIRLPDVALQRLQDTETFFAISLLRLRFAATATSFLTTTTTTTAATTLAERIGYHQR